jgi:signal transduction histidine kinase/CheY-like chemotaxis protein
MRKSPNIVWRPDDPHLTKIRLAQVDALYRDSALGVLGALAASIILAGVLVAMNDLQWSNAIIWIALGTGCVSFHMILRHFYLAASKADIAWRPWAYWFTVAAFADGIWWGCATIFLVSPAMVEGQLLILLVALIVAIGAVPAFGSYIPSFRAIFFPITSLALAWNIYQGGLLHYGTSVLIGVFIVTMYGLARYASANFTQILRLSFEKQLLADDLQRQKELAEDANRSKSRFLAAASHDLRQPIHALGMFVGALSRHSMNGEMRQIVDHMEDSIAAMDGLFSSLLDISKLDAGVVQPHLEPFQLAPLLARICHEYSSAAEEQNLSFILCHCTAVVVSDQLLLERVLRNLISNAIRYTNQGRILVGCRRGRALSVQIWDTGCGIAPSEQARVFDEFYQVENSERDRNKGLGLGLAIVKRLTVLLGHPLELKSEVGKGSVFKLSLPIADLETHHEMFSIPNAVPISRGGLILVVEDDPMVREAMRSLLTSWDNEVIVAGSGAEALERATECATRPDLILCDYRLRGEENGIDVIDRLRAEYNEDIAAILITGDTASDRLQKARDRGFVVLNKPVARSKLRAAIGNAMNSRRRLSPADENYDDMTLD